MTGKKRTKDGEAKPRGLDIGQLAHFVGNAANEAVMGLLRGEGFPGLRQSHALLLQHLLEGPRSASELARLLGVTQQSASKRVAELAGHGYLEDAESPDARTHTVQLSERGRAALAVARTARRNLEADLREAIGDGAVTSAKRVLVQALDRLGGPAAARPRRVPARREDA